ncbi:MAG TPA: secondary thiamine-phosphate synthase enzyme YjbQ [Kofleriaceae bacterium]|nr:secondary thiamine-phosphate synthase enzyme YjbQ [Kofleriaceae bacterium]
MPSMETIDVKTTTRSEMIDITSLVRAAVRRSGVSDGLVCVFCPHTTAGVAIQENSDPQVKSDMVRHLGLLVPREAGSERPDQNSDAHIKGSVIGQSVTLIVEGGRPQLGNWQAVFFCEFDGPRDRRVLLRVLAG